MLRGTRPGRGPGMRRQLWPSQCSTSARLKSRRPDLGYGLMMPATHTSPGPRATIPVSSTSRSAMSWASGGITTIRHRRPSNADDAPASARRADRPDVVRAAGGQRRERRPGRRLPVRVATPTRPSAGTRRVQIPPRDARSTPPTHRRLRPRQPRPTRPRSGSTRPASCGRPSAQPRIRSNPGRERRAPAQSAPQPPTHRSETPQRHPETHTQAAAHPAHPTFPRGNFGTRAPRHTTPLFAAAFGGTADDLDPAQPPHTSATKPKTTITGRTRRTQALMRGKSVISHYDD